MGNGSSSLEDRMFYAVLSLLREEEKHQAPMITGMLLEMGSDQVEKLLVSEDLLKSAVDRSLQACHSTQDYSTRGQIQACSTPGQIQTCSTPGQIQACSTPGQIQACSTPGQIQACSTPGQIQACSTPGQTQACSTPGQIQACSTPGQIQACSTPEQIQACSTPEQIQACSTPVQIQACSTPGQIQACSTPKQIQACNTTWQIQACSTLRQAQASSSARTDLEDVGDLLYEKVEKLCPDQAAKITGMLLELDRHSVEEILTSDTLLLTAVQRAEHVCMSASGPGLTVSGIDRQTLGDCVFEKVAKMYPDCAEKITGMILEQPEAQIQQVLHDEELLLQYIHRAYKAMQAPT